MKKAFTLLELLIVVVVIGILVSLILPRYIATIERAKSAEAVTNVISIKTSVDRYWYQNRSWPGDNNFAALDIEDPNTITGILYSYTFTNTGTTSALRSYTVNATRTVGATTYWVRWTQTNNTTGKLYKSNTLGGPES